jgi:hypothetical protein
MVDWDTPLPDMDDGLNDRRVEYLIMDNGCMKRKRVYEKKECRYEAKGKNEEDETCRDIRRGTCTCSFLVTTR